MLSKDKESTYTYRLYLTMQGIIGLLFAMIFTVEILYHVEVVKLNPLRVVLLGTILEGTVFVCEVPTGILADVKSRKLSIIIGYMLMGIGFLVEGGFPIFVAAAVAQVLWGLGYTFTSGAVEAWIVDELQGTVDTGHVFLRGHQAGRFGNFSGILLGTVLGNIRLGLPILLGGALLVAFGLVLLFMMPENHYAPQTREYTLIHNMGGTMKKAFGLVRTYHVLGILLLVGVFYGGHSEGIDRLWTPFLTQQFRLPFVPYLSAVTWVGIIGIMLSLGALGGAEILKRLNVTKDLHLIRKVLFGFIATIVLSIIAFGAAPTFWIALTMFMTLKLFQGMSHPLYQTWFNSHITDSQVRATMFSISGQSDAIGQITCGPMVGYIGKTYGLHMAFYASAAILSPVLGLYLLIHRCYQNTRMTEVREEEHVCIPF